MNAEDWRALGKDVPHPRGVGRQLRNVADQLAQLPAYQLEAIAARAEWKRIARPPQFMPDRECIYWLHRAGRGYGKTRTGAEDAWWDAFKYPGLITAVVGATNDDTRKICFEGPAGILACMPLKLRKKCKWNRSEMVLVLPNGSQLLGYSAEKPDRLRGPQHHKVWGDEVAAWKNPTDMWDQISFGLRLKYIDPRTKQEVAKFPCATLTTTPRPIALIKELIADEDTVVVSGSTFDNAANLAPKQLAKLKKKYEGTRLGRQELYGEILDDILGALWTYKLIERQRVKEPPKHLARVVISIDPAVTANEDSDETGIVAAGRDHKMHGYVLDDESGIWKPEEWASKAVALYRKHRADCIVGEVNNGGDLVEMAIRAVDPKIPFKQVRASRGKITRAEPVSMLYQQGEVWHVGGFATMEDQMCSYSQGDPESPDRMDAAVWALTELLLPDETPHATVTSLPAVPIAIPLGY